MPIVQIDGFAMNVEIHEGVLPMDTVFLHGNLASNNWWKPSLEVWKKQAEPQFEGRMIMAEWRGCGKSSRAEDETELEMPRLANDYVQMMNQLNIKKACLVGHSTGGLIGLYAMLKAPALFDRAVLLDPVGASGVQFPAEMYDAFTKMSQDREFCKTVMSGTIHGVDLNSQIFHQVVEDAFSVGSANWNGIPRSLGRVTLAEHLHQILHPVLILRGEHDAIISKDDCTSLADGLIDGRYRELKGQGHSTNVENPELFVRLTTEFLFHRDYQDHS